MAEAYEQQIEDYSQRNKAESDKALADQEALTRRTLERVERTREERKPYLEDWQKAQTEAEQVPIPKLKPAPQPPNTQEMLQPTSLQKTMGMASIFALLSVGLAKGHATAGLSAMSGFLRGAREGNAEQAKAAIDDFNSNMRAVDEMNKQAAWEYDKIIGSKKLTLQQKEQMYRMKALEFNDELSVQAIEQGGLTAAYKIRENRDKTSFGFMKEVDRHEQMSQRIELQRQRLAQGAGGGAGQTVFGIPMADIPQAPPGQKNEAFLQMLPPAQQEIIKRVARGDIDLKTYGGMGTVAAANRINYGNAAVLYDPNYKTRQAGILEKAEKEATPGGKIGSNELAINTLAHHIDQYAENFKKLNNSQVQKWNSAKNKMQTEFGDPALGNVQAPAFVAAEELARIAKGGTAAPTEKETDRFLTIFDTSGSPQQAIGRIWETLKIAGGRLVAIEDSYRKAGIERTVLTPEARELILKYKPKNVPTPDWLKPKKSGAANLSDLEKQAELTDKEKGDIKSNIYPRARNPKTGEVLIFKGGQWQSP